MDDLIRIENVDFAYRDSLVLKRVTLCVSSGTTLGVIGPNGGGKTTLMRLLLGLLKPTRGSIRIAGLEPPQAVARGDIIGYLPQTPRLPESLPLNVRQLVRLGLAGKTGLLKGYRPDDCGFVESLMQMVGISELADVPIVNLSGGQLQLALIARALAPRPRILLLDEPTTGIDHLAQQRFIDSLTKLKSQMDLTVVLVSHDLRAVAAISDRIGCLNVTLHYHDVPEHMPPDLMYRLFACDLQAFGLSSTAQPHVPHQQTPTPAP
ncbi:MAG TPA: metal ABC transporter ATP-binding protein [Tepidisphaeraceae bacterium]|jgi:zinc transport system ATP-binding protein